MALKRSYRFSECLLQEYTGIFILECCLVSVLPISTEQSHGPVEILFLGSEEVFVLEFLSFICWSKFMDFRDRRGAGLVYVRYVFHPSTWMLRLRIRVLDWEQPFFLFKVAFRTCSCDVLFIFLCPMTPSNNDKPILLSKKEQQQKSIDSCPIYLHPLNFFWEVLTLNSLELL